VTQPIRILLVPRQTVTLAQVTEQHNVIVLMPSDSARLYSLVSDILDHLEVERNRRDRTHLPTDHETDAIERAVDVLAILDENIVV